MQLRMGDFPLKSVRQFRVVKLGTECQNNAGLRDCGDSHSDSCNKESQIIYVKVKLPMSEMVLKFLQFHKLKIIKNIFHCHKKYIQNT